MNCINKYINVVKLNNTKTVILCRDDCCCCCIWDFTVLYISLNTCIYIQDLIITLIITRSISLPISCE